MEWWMWLALIGFMTTIIYSIVSVASVTGKNADMLSAIFTATSVNGALCLGLAGIGYFSVNQSPAFKRPYIFFVLHAAILFSMIAVAEAAFRQLGVDPTTMKPATSTPAKTSAPAPDLLQVALGLGSTGFALGIISVIGVIYLYRSYQR